MQVPAAKIPEEAAAPQPMTKAAVAKALLLAALFALCFYRPMRELHYLWTLPDSYYLHGFLIPPVCLYFAWRQRHELAAAPQAPSGWGVVLIALSCIMLLASELLGVRVVGHLAILVILAGFVLAFYGIRHLLLLWFPIVFLLAMIPVPHSVIQSFALQIKLLATEAAVRLANLCALPHIRDGSYVYFGEDHFIIGDVCGGLRSLISLLSVGAVVAYIGRMKVWARLLLFALSGPIAVIANIARIFVLCVAGYFVGSQKATGKFHDVSGLLIFIVAFILLFSLDSLFRRIAPLDKENAS